MDMTHSLRPLFWLLILFSLTAVSLTACGDEEYYEDEEGFYDEEEFAEADTAVNPEQDANFDTANGGAANSGAASSDTAYFEEADCPVDPIDSSRVTCGYLIVPENRDDPNSPTIELPIAILASSSANPAPDPILFLQGGPGGSGLEDIEGWLESPYLEERDIILFDQRGTGLAYPTLDCPEVDEYDSNLDAMQACHDRLQDEGVDTSQYNSAANAADVADMRLALGIEEWNLLGVSYGTRLAMTVMRDYPAGIRSVILDSPYPPNVQAYSEQAINALLAIDTLFAGCRADAECDDAFPDLEAIFYELVADLNDNPVELEGELYDGATLVNGIFSALYDVTAIPWLPVVIYEAYEGNYDPLLEFTGEGYGRFQFQNDEIDTSDSEGMFYSVECHEEIPFNDYDTAVASIDDYPESARIGLLADIDELFAICDFWNAGQPANIENNPVRSSIPTLILVGEYDPVTPPPWAQAAAAQLSQVFTYVFPGVGHAVLDSGDCAQNLIIDFLDNPTREPNAACVDDMEGPLFELSW
jgi:pimeloyl-ACP methyl ester carboxylesterase